MCGVSLQSGVSFNETQKSYLALSLVNCTIKLCIKTDLSCLISTVVTGYVSKDANPFLGVAYHSQSSLYLVNPILFEFSSMLCISR